MGRALRGFSKALYWIAWTEVIGPVADECLQTPRWVLRWLKGKSPPSGLIFEWSLGEVRRLHPVDASLVVLGFLLRLIWALALAAGAVFMVGFFAIALGVFLFLPFLVDDVDASESAPAWGRLLVSLLIPLLAVSWFLWAQWEETLWGPRLWAGASTAVTGSIPRICPGCGGTWIPTEEELALFTGLEHISRRIVTREHSRYCPYRGQEALDCCSGEWLAADLVRISIPMRTFVLIFAFLLALASGLYPPWQLSTRHGHQASAYGWLFSPPAPPRGIDPAWWRREIDLKRLGVQWVLIWTAAGGLLLLVRKAERPRD